MKTKPESAPRTERDIALQTNELAKWLMHWKWGQEPESADHRFWDSANTKARGCWDAACHIQDLLRQTDAENALENMLQEQAQGAPFMHTPRPAVAGSEARFAHHRRYGAGEEAAFHGLDSANQRCRVSLFRRQPDSTAELRLEGEHGHMRARFTPEALRELARCLIDAAADIEGGAQ